VERTAGGIITPGLLERHPAIDQVDDIDSREELINER
jgi:hypothetical protein